MIFFLFVCIFFSSHVRCITESVLTANNYEGRAVSMSDFEPKQGNQALGGKAHRVCKAGQ